MMSPRTALLLLPLISQLMIQGASGTEWSVKYHQQNICAVKGSTVFINGTYTHPEGLTVTETFWVIDRVLNPSWSDMSKDPDYSGRVKNLTDEQKHFSLKLSDVMKKDEHEYCFRIITNEQKERWLGTPGVHLRVTDLHVESPEEVTEGQTADLTCRTTCSLTDPTFIWYKNGRPLTTKTINYNQLHLQTVSSEDAGSYSCAVRGSEHLHSTDQNLRVRYPPKNISVSISPSGKIVEGSSVTLTCSSDANPPVKNYTWFKEGGTSPVGSGHSYSPLQSGFYYCQAQNEHGVRRSASVSVSVKGFPYAVISAVAGVGCGVFVLVVISIVFIRKNRRLQKNEDLVENTVYSEIWATPANSNAALSGSDSTEVIYANVSQETSRAESSLVKTSVCTAAVEEEINEEMTQEDEVQYACVRFHQSPSTDRYNEETEDSPSAIYSSVR